MPSARVFGTKTIGSGHQFKPTFKEASLLDDPELLPAVTEINKQILELAPVLNSPTIRGAVRIDRSSPGSQIAVLCKRYDGAVYAFAVNIRNSPARAAVELPDAESAATARVLGEDRSLEIVEGRFQDEFEPYGVHLYRAE